MLSRWYTLLTRWNLEKKETVLDEFHTNYHYHTNDNHSIAVLPMVRQRRLYFGNRSYPLFDFIFVWHISDAVPG